MATKAPRECLKCKHYLTSCALTGIAIRSFLGSDEEKEEWMREHCPYYLERLVWKEKVNEGE